MQAIAGRSRLITKVQFVVLRRRLPDSTRHAFRRSVEFTQVSDLTIWASVGDCYGVAQFRDIDPNKYSFLYRYSIRSSLIRTGVYPTPERCFSVRRSEPFPRPGLYYPRRYVQSGSSMPQATAQRREACLTAASTTQRLGRSGIARLIGANPHAKGHAVLRSIDAHNRFKENSMSPSLTDSNNPKIYRKTSSEQMEPAENNLAIALGVKGLSLLCVDGQ